MDREEPKIIEGTIGWFPLNHMIVRRRNPQCSRNSFVFGLKPEMDEWLKNNMRGEYFISQFDFARMGDGLVRQDHYEDFDSIHFFNYEDYFLYKLKWM